MDAAIPSLLPELQEKIMKQWIANKVWQRNKLHRELECMSSAAGRS